MAGNSNLLRAGGWGPATATAADVDGDATNLCIGRAGNRGASCADNSSSATLDLPPGASVLQARLYVAASVSESVGPLRVRLAGPADGPAYTELGVETEGVPKVGEASGAAAGQPDLRQATWDVTAFVAGRGGGSYTVADIVNERSGPWLPYASWGLVVAYELADGVQLAELAPEVQPRFAPRALSWHDGLAVVAEAPVEVEVGGFQVPADRRVFAKSFHLVAHAGAAGFENVTFDGGPIGNNATPGDAPPPAGVVIGTDPACNTTVDVLNDSICSLGTAVTNKAPGPADFRAASDGTTSTSGSAVDLDVVRIPDRYLQPGRTSATMAVDVVGDGAVVVGLLAVSVDQVGL